MECNTHFERKFCKPCYENHKGACVGCGVTHSSDNSVVNESGSDSYDSEYESRHEMMLWEEFKAKKDLGTESDDGENIGEDEVIDDDDSCGSSKAIGMDGSVEAVML